MVVVDVEALEGRAGLPGVDERTPEQVFGDGFGVGVGQDDAGVVAAEFHGEPFDGVCGGLDDGLAGGGGAGEHDLADGGVFGEAGADLPAAGHGGEDTVGELFVEDLDQREDAQRSVAGGLDDDGVAHPQGGGDLPDGDHHGPVPGADRADDADGPVVQFGAGFAVVHDGFRLQGNVAAAREPGGAGADFEAGVGPVQGFSLLAGEQLGEFLGGAFDGVGCFEERGGPGVVAQGGPGGLGGNGSGDRGFEVFDGVHRGFADGLARGRVQNGAAALARGRGDPGEQ